VTEHRAVAAGEHGRPAAPDNPDYPMPDRVHAAVERMQPPGAQPPVDRRHAEPERHELPASDDAALSARQRGDRVVDCGFASHTDA